MKNHCEKLLECLSDYIDGELAPELCKKIEEHTAKCVECACVLEKLKETVNILNSLPVEKVPKQKEKEILETIKKCFSDNLI